MSDNSCPMEDSPYTATPSSCGSGAIYDGTFSKALIPGDGVAAARLKEEGVAVYGESSIGQLLSDMERQV